MKLLRYALVISVLALVSTPSAVFAGFGITPPYVKNERLTQGSEYVQEIILVRGDPDQDLKAEITINMPGVEDWFTIDRGEEFILPEGEAQVPMKVIVRVPENAAFDRYTGNIRIRTISPDLTSGVSIALGAQIDVDIRVVDQIRDFDVKRVQLSEAEEPRRRWWLDFPGKINFSVTLNNTGNAPVAPDRVVFDIYDKRGTVVLEQTEATNKMDLIEPFATQPTVAELPTYLPPGAYLVNYKIYLEDEVKREGELTLSILPEGTLQSYDGYGFMGLSPGDKLSLIIPPLVLVIGMIAAVVIARTMNRRSSRPKRSRREPVDEPLPREPSRVRTPARSVPANRSAPRTRSERPTPGSPHGVVDLSKRTRDN